MSWTATADSAADSLLECLRRVQLEQFAGHFATRGITDFTKLAMLQRHQFATYGITSPADVERLTRLITILRDVRADGTSRQPDAGAFHKTAKTQSVPGDLSANRRAAGACGQKRVRRGQPAARHAVTVDFDGPPSFSPPSRRTVSDLPTHVQKVTHNT